jgi:coenzyme PQQ precursor peptide PqqA
MASPSIRKGAARHRIDHATASGNRWVKSLSSAGDEPDPGTIVPSRRISTRGVLLFRPFGTISLGTSKEESMAWTTPVLVEICIGLEINGYMPADGYVPPEF